MSKLKNHYFDEIEELARERFERGENDSPPEPKTTERECQTCGDITS